MYTLAEPAHGPQKKSRASPCDHLFYFFSTHVFIGEILYSDVLIFFLCIQQTFVGLLGIAGPESTVETDQHNVESTREVREVPY